MGKATVARRAGAAAVAVAMIGAGAACSSGTSGGPEPSTSASASQSAPAEPFTGFIEPVTGTAGTVSYTAELPQLRGGDAAVRDRFNAAMRAALDGYLTPTEDNTPTTVAPGILDEDDRSEVSHIGTGAVAGVLLLNIFVDRAAHPFNTVATAVIDARTAEPIMIRDLFTDEAAGLAKLVDGITAEIATEEKLSGQAAPEPVAEQFANWLPDDDGVVVYIPVAHVLGDYYPVTVDWNSLADVLVPGMREKLTT